MNRTATILLLVLCVIIVASLPELLTIDEDSVRFRPTAPVRLVREFVRGFRTGENLSFVAGQTPRSLADTLPRYALNTIIFVLPSAILGLTIGITGGLLTARYRRPIAEELLYLAGSVPSFSLAVLLQFGAVQFYQRTGVRLVRVAYMTLSDPALALPVLTMSLVTCLYILRFTATETRRILASDYVSFAYARGLSRRMVYRRHVFPALVHHLDGGLHGFLGLVIANLFILERTFSVPGMTQLIVGFGYYIRRSYNFERVYQFHLIVIGFAGIIALYFAVYWMLRGALRLAVRMAVDDW